MFSQPELSLHPLTWFPLYPINLNRLYPFSYQPYEKHENQALFLNSWSYSPSNWILTIHCYILVHCSFWYSVYSGTLYILVAMPNQWTQSQRLQCQRGKKYPLTVIKAEYIPTDVYLQIYVTRLVILIYIFTGFTQIYIIVFKQITTNETSGMIVTVCFLLFIIIPATAYL